MSNENLNLRSVEEYKEIIGLIEPRITELGYKIEDYKNII